ncbi:MAG: dienelactone hydrolase family protein, partial [Deltaproteobacteria bacterium]|nr:dienelactone hydrolase family protein [Deltaproteobacteria bacterium]
MLEAAIEIEREDGVRLPGVQIDPDAATAAQCNGAGVLVVAGEWGLTPEDHARFVRPLAEFGYYVIATDLVRGRRTGSSEDARARAAGLDHAIAIDDLAAGILSLRQLARGRLGVLGLDLAATIALE